MSLLWCAYCCEGYMLQQSVPSLFMTTWLLLLFVMFLVMPKHNRLCPGWLALHPES